MKKVITALFSLALVALSGAVSAAPINVTLVKHNQVSTTTVSTLVWKECPPPVPPATYVAPCINPGNPWVIANSIDRLQCHLDLGSGHQGPGLHRALLDHLVHRQQSAGVLGDQRPGREPGDRHCTNEVTTATKYDCVEGNFLSGVNANGCGSYDLGVNGVDNSSIVYNVVSDGYYPDPDPYCVVRTLGGDDVGTRATRAA